MARIVVSFWLPRSPANMYEIREHMPEMKLEFGDSGLDEKLFFEVKNFLGYECVSYCCDAHGLSKIQAFFPDDDLEGCAVRFREDAKTLFLDWIYGVAQPVATHQLRDGVLPLLMHTTILSEKASPVEGVCYGEVDGIRLFFDESRLYKGDSILYVSGSEDPGLDKVLDYFSYIVLFSHFNYWVVDLMTGLYRKSVEVAEQLDEGGELRLLKELTVSTGLIRRNCSESFGRIKQAVGILGFKRGDYTPEDFTPVERDVAAALGVDCGFKRLDEDADYILSLWENVLLGNLSNLSFAVGARIDLQESFETVKERREMKLLQAIFLIGVIASLLTLGAMPGARLTFYSPTGEVIGSGSLSAFNLSELLTYGVFAISFAIVLFLILNFIYENIAKKYINR